MTSSFDTNPPSQGQPRQGNLQTVLTSYDHGMAAAAQAAQHGQQQAAASLHSAAAAGVSDGSECAGTDGEGAGGAGDDGQQHQQLDFRGRSDTLGSLAGIIDFHRDRSSTLGSAADVVADCLGPFVVDPSPPGPVGLSGGPAPGAVAANGSDAAAVPMQAHAAASGHQHHQHQPLPRPPAFPGMCHIDYDADGTSSSSAAAAAAQRAIPQQQQQQAAGGRHRPPSSGSGSGGGSNPPSQPSSNDSTSGFLSGSFGTAQHQVQRQQQPQQQNAIPGAQQQHHQHQQQQQQAVAHTPPSALGPASYEAKHFGKRMRAGSISGRLRSASDLEDRGVIDRTQKGIIKDLIISGDDALQAALDRYEQGDAAELEAMIKSGRLQAHQSANDIDILGDLDLDFLTVDESFGELAAEAGGAGDVGGVGGGAVHPGHPGEMHAHHHDAHPNGGAPSDTSSGGYDGAGVGDDSLRARAPSVSHQQPAPVPSGGGGGYVDDGIGDLEFNADYIVSTEEELNLPSADGHVHQQVQQQQQQQQGLGHGGDAAAGGAAGTPQRQPSQSPHPGAPSSAEEGRYRANSLAFGGLLDEASTQQQQSSSTFANWMDKTPAGMGSGGKEQQRKGGIPAAAAASSNIVGTSGGIYIINNDGRAAERTKSEINMTANAINRLEQAAERKREKELKKEAREREKVEKRERKERESREKKEREARERQERKEKKEAAARAKRDEKNRRRSLSPKREGKVEKAMGQQDRMGSDDEEERKETPSGLGLPRSMSDPNLTVGLDSDGLLQIDAPEGWVGAYSPDSRKIRIERFLAKRNHRVWTKKVKYDVRKNFADSRLRVKGRFVKKEDELLMRDLMSLT